MRLAGVEDDAFVQPTFLGPDHILIPAAARVMTGFQRLATAVGAAQQSDKTPGRQPNADVKRRTDLLLTAAPGPGSIILTGTLRTSPIAETGHAGGKVGMFTELETDDQMPDTAVAAANDVFTADNDIGPAPQDSAFVRQLGDTGPRTGSAVRDLAKTLNRGQFNLEIAWWQPRGPPAALPLPPPTWPPRSSTLTSTNNP
ncbi:Uncharacterised protein [Mycobacteroides abscessus subsp. abscessus]|nr:Uncharacterised protein [Mycobacteroides abscessus subsp. abscessus]SHW93999.1 Uncharacterised protein [Mycobacteroides abscessus subsp. abscessus]SHW99498.1 Uncharacterised protein [Mycobacteroides abscessus subsp. abscessus]SHZ94665.1 Uncharacterised protein [Mycobacteroides abscessus subsp. abscessus]SIB82348.1 Uncharacterised protein [Mycobacteroides abscessus subsp. abscessus]